MAENTEKGELSKEDVISRIIAYGLNHLVYYVDDKTESEERKILESFAKDSFEIILPCFDSLHAKMQLYVFKHHKDKFVEFMKSKVESEES